MDTTLPSPAAFGKMFLSVFPGAGHLVADTKKRALLGFSIWLALIALTINFYGSTLGSLLLGLTISWHTMLIFDIGNIRKVYDKLRPRIAFMLCLLILTAGIYFYIDTRVRRRWNFIESPVTYEFIDVLEGDTLLVRMKNYKPDELVKGNLVIFQNRRARPIFLRGNRYLAAGNGDPVLGRIVAQSDDEICISSKGLEVNGKTISLQSAERNIPFPKRAYRLKSPKIKFLCPRIPEYKICLIILLWTYGGWLLQ